MIDPATGMKNGERYAIERLGDTHPFTGFFLDGKYYIAPDAPSAAGWLEGQTFIYEDRDSAGKPLFPDRIAGTISHLTFTMVSGESVQLATVKTDSPIASQPYLASSEAKKQQTMPLRGPLRGKLVVITGASSGIGRATAKAFACKGARLVLAARDEEALYEVLDECTDCGTDAVAVTTDVTSSEQMLELAARAAEFGDGRIDVWINNAGIGAVGTFEDTPLEAHEQVLQTDLLGYLRGAYVVMPYFKAQKSGTLINTLSIGSWVAQPYAAAYSASKFGLRGLTEALRGELTEFSSIHVCDIYPAVMDTPGFRDGGNYTGHALKPPPPVYDPELVAQAMVACAIKPRATTMVGAASYVARLAPRLIPGLTSITGWLTRKAINQSPASATSSGNLFSPPSGGRSVEGGWRKSQHTSPVLLAITASVLGGCLFYLIARKNRRY